MTRQIGQIGIFKLTSCILKYCRSGNLKLPLRYFKITSYNLNNCKNKIMLQEIGIGWPKFNELK